MVIKSYSNDELFRIVVETIAKGKEVYHKWYQHTIDHARQCKQFMTGDDQTEILVRWKKKESQNEAQKEQRIRIYNSRTQYASNRVVSVFNRAHLSDNITSDISYGEKNDTNKEKLSQLGSRLDEFYENDTLDHYLTETVQHLNFYDPNAFLISNFTEYDFITEKAFSYPVEVYSEQAVRYEYSNGRLLYLIARQELEFKDMDMAGEKVKKTGEQFWLFAKDIAIHFEEMPENMAPEPKPGYQEYAIKKSGITKLYRYRIFDIKSKMNPAIRVGYLKDPRTNRETVVSPLYPAEKLYYDIIFTKSEYDLAKALHWFYQKFIYAPECQYRDPKNPTDFCQRGKMSLTGEKCPECEGEGLSIHTTVQDIVIVKMPNSLSEVVPLSNMVHYQEIPKEMVDSHKEEVKQLVVDIFQAVFNSQSFERSEISVTATEKKLDLQAIYNVLKKYGDNYSKIYKHFVKLTAIYMSMDDDLEVKHSFRSDFAMESLMEKLEQRSKAVTSNAPYNVIAAIDHSILADQNRDDPESVLRFKARERHRPFKTKSETERISIVSMLSKTDPARILYQYFDEIMTDIENDREQKIPFWEMDYMDQKELIETKVEEYKTRIQEETKARTARMAFLQPVEDNQDPDQIANPGVNVSAS